MITETQQVEIVKALRKEVKESDFHAMVLLAKVDNVITQFSWDTNELSGLILQLWEAVEKK